jgi:hypothetical protein
MHTGASPCHRLRSLLPRPRVRPKHLEIWEHPETAPKIEKLPLVTWSGHICTHVMHALNELPPEARGTFLKDLGDFIRRQQQAVERRTRDKAKRGRS